MSIVDPEAERKRLADFYSRQLDGELEEIASEAGELTPLARQVLTEELHRRGLISATVGPTSPIGEAEQSQALEAASAGQSSPSPEFEEPVLVASFRDLPEALIASGSLTSAGITCALVDDNTIRMDWLWSNLLGGVKLLVEAGDAEIARHILAQPIPESFETDDTKSYQQPRCPKCGSLDVSFEELHKIAFASLFVSFPLPIHHQGWICKSCKHSWQDAEDQAHIE